MSRDSFEEQWLADLPSEWVQHRADFLCQSYRVTVDPERFGDDLVAHYSIPQVQETGGPAIEPASDIASLKLLIREPTLLVSKLNPRKSTICIAIPDPSYPTLASSEFVALSSDKFDQKYAYYLWSSEKVRDRLSALTQSATRSHQRVNPADITKIIWKWPSLDTQQRIVRFLDEKTARIDILIEKKQALLKRLAEMRQALITRAVTKGLNPDAQMKPSGVDWLGEVPAHWEVVPLKRVVRYQEGPGILAIDFRDEGTPLLRVASVGGRYATLDGVNYLEPAMVHKKWGHFLTMAGDLLISASATSGIVSEVSMDTAGCIPYTGIIRINSMQGQADSSFIRQLLVSDVFLSQIDQLKAGSTIQHFGPYHLGLMNIAKPPLDEQAAIGAKVDLLIRELDSNVQRVGKGIDLLSEYRSALITAAVIGQLPELNG
ncbi:type I restriction enzyme S subunit [Xanthomonas arboricola]|uniref:restriction endonuclease subunit S n=1 Tax=Xanthomonas arboricola TaxID=56448 RepID=UPI00141AAE32|nr:restriction endonuclease subunit S [Xanthomonas arboricola]NIK34914.1 type I restriction enzyme S subunit [Xanthomonas arboricola]